MALISYGILFAQFSMNNAPHSNSVFIRTSWFLWIRIDWYAIIQAVFCSLASFVDWSAQWEAVRERWAFSKDTNLESASVF
jgi:hypothetical protein